MQNSFSECPTHPGGKNWSNMVLAMVANECSAHQKINQENILEALNTVAKISFHSSALVGAVHLHIGKDHDSCGIVYR